MKKLYYFLFSSVGLVIFPFVGGYVMVLYFFTPTTCIVPDITGKSVLEALESITKQNLGLKLHRLKEVAGMHGGIIIEQFPKHETYVRPYQQIRVVVSKECEFIEVPYLIGHVDRKKMQSLVSESMALELFYVPHRFLQGTCIAQTPNPGKITKDKKCIAYLSSGIPSLYIVPNVVGLPEKQVVSGLAQYAIESEVVVLNQTDSENRIVVDQKPTAGSIVDISKGLCMQLGVAS